jgi:hypothetical protein
MSDQSKPLTRRPLISMGELAVFVAYAGWLLILYTITVSVLQYASGIALPNPIKLLPPEYLRWLGYGPRF